jgi:hypothetical protein
MQYALLIYEQPGAYDGTTDEQRKAITGEYMAVREDPRIVGGVRLKPAETATTVREHLVTDGPFANTKEVFGGYYIFEDDNLDAALEIARALPVIRMGGAVEVRPIA